MISSAFQCAVLYKTAQLQKRTCSVVQQLMQICAVKVSISCQQKHDF